MAKTEQREAVEQLLALLDEVAERRARFERGPAVPDHGVLLFPAELALLRAIGRDPTTSVTRLATVLAITKGAVSQTLGKLARKRLVRKRRAPESRRDVLLELTALGTRAFQAHERHRAEVHAAVREHYAQDVDRGVAAARRALEDLVAVFDALERRTAAM